MPANAPPEPAARRIAGRYRLAGALGRGAMGTVWSGVDEVLQREVAVKELSLPPGVPPAEVADLRERMLREARALGGLTHPNVITVYDVVEEAGEPFVVLELLPSRSLSAVVTDHGRLDAGEAAAVGAAVAGALLAAHRSGITHRDVKPGNVLVADDGRIKLTDFGIARNAADVTITMTGLVLGSPAYIAPEVAAGGAVTPAADLWGLGATLFAATEGRPPYDVRGEPMATITEVVYGAVPRPSGAGPVAEVITALMRKDPARRLALEDVHRRLGALLPDVDEPLFPAGGAAPGRARAAVPAPRVHRSRRVTPDAEGTPAGESAPLAASPGPVPADPRHPSAPRRAGVGLLIAVLLVLLGALVVLAGVAGGWAVTRLLAGQSPLTSTLVGELDPAAPLVGHTDRAGFAVAVPAGWPVSAQGGSGARFLSPDGAAELRIDRVDGSRASPALPARFVSALTPGELAVDRVSIDEPLRPVLAGATEPAAAQQLRYRTEAGPTVRVVWTRLVPHGVDLWVLRLSVPAGRDAAGAELFARIAAGFAPS